MYISSREKKRRFPPIESEIRRRKKNRRHSRELLFLFSCMFTSVVRKEFVFICDDGGII